MGWLLSEKVMKGKYLVTVPPPFPVPLVSVQLPPACNQH